MLRSLLCGAPHSAPAPPSSSMAHKKDLYDNQSFRFCLRIAPFVTIFSLGAWLSLRR